MKLYINYKTKQQVVVGEKLDYSIRHHDLIQRGYELAMFIGGNWDSVNAWNPPKGPATDVELLYSPAMQQKWKDKTPLIDKYKIIALEAKFKKLDKLSN